VKARKLKLIGVVLGAVVLALSVAAEAQQPAKKSEG